MGGWSWTSRWSLDATPSPPLATGPPSADLDITEQTVWQPGAWLPGRWALQVTDPTPRSDQ